MPVEAVALSARCEMMRMRPRPLPTHWVQSLFRVATRSTVFRMVSINCRSTLVRYLGDATK
eukprot:6213908-Pleurochrysis_carterae.AAC.2